MGVTWEVRVGVGVLFGWELLERMLLIVGVVLALGRCGFCWCGFDSC